MQDGGGVTEPPSDFATADEVLEAIEGLTEINKLRLMKAARIYLDGSEYADPRELVDQAVSTPYFAARGEGGRRWPKGTDFVAFLIMSIRGLASDSRGSAVRRRTVSTRVPAGDHGEERDLLDTTQHATLSIEDAEIEEERAGERHLDDEAKLAQVEKLCASDPQIGWVVKGIKEEKTAHEIQNISGMSKLEYDTAQKRWRRKSEKLFPGRRTP